jgi:peptidyl-prolyl cis-trans isomerase SurA
MVKKLLITLLIGLPLIVQSQENKDEILMTIHNRKITLGEFERIYHKNNSNPSIEQQSVEEYLELFINFKLKVIEAEELGLDTTESFLREFNGYKKQLAKPYLSDKEEVGALVQEAFERAQYDIHASHIMIRCDEFASPEDTLKAYEKAMQIRERLLSGDDFGTVARATSDDPSVKTNSGDLGYFTVFRMVYPFETGAYNTPEGEISMPARSRYGYHLIKIHDKRPARGQVRVAHIMVMTPESMNDEEKLTAEKKINQYYDSLKQGADFADLAMKYSEDRGSAARGGELQWFGTGRMVPEFENAAFALENTGDYSKPIKTSFGWHIIKLLEKKGVDNFEQIKPELESNVTRSDRSVFSRKALISKIKNQYDFREYLENLYDFYTMIDTTFFDKQWHPGDINHLDQTLFKIGDTEFTQADFASYLEQNQGGRKMDIQVLVNIKYNDFLDNTVLQYEEDQLIYKYPEFKHLVQEYHDGILLFDLTDQMVWSKAVKDSSGLEKFYQDHKSDYMWDERLDATIYTCRDEKTANRAKEILTKKSKKKISPEQLIESVIKEFADSSCISFDQGIYEKGDNEFVDQMDWNTSISDNINKNERVIFIVKNKTVKPTPRKLDEARGLVTADYQTYLEKQWIDELRNKYLIEINRSLLSKVEKVENE